MYSKPNSLKSTHFTTTSPKLYAFFDHFATRRFAMHPGIAFCDTCAAISEFYQNKVSWKAA